MANPDDYLYEYAVIRYVPRIDRGEFLNVGLIMMCKRRRWIHCELHLDETRLRALDPSLDLPVLRRQLSMFEKKDIPFPDLPVEERYRWLTAAKSAIIQTSSSHPGLAPASGEITDPLEPLHETFSRLMDELVR
ncbi:MAG: DUF3037 domain-containing protein [Muribaculaceae bacterium]|nr:DUF3037 domain-containing protein [Muribaculaceae bacterium]